MASAAKAQGNKVPLLEPVYLVSSCIGFVYIVGTAIMGQLGGDDSADDGGDADDGGIDGDDGIAEGDDGGIDGPDDAPSQSNSLSAKVAHGARVGPHIRSTGIFFAIAKIFSPLRIALILFLFGTFGIILSRLLPSFGIFIAVVSALLGLLVADRVLQLFGRLVRTMERSESYKKQDAIGLIGSLTVPIVEGGVGEITFVHGGSRTHGPARANVSTQSFDKASRVLISDFRDGVYLVESADDFS